MIFSMRSTRWRQLSLTSTGESGWCVNIVSISKVDVCLGGCLISFKSQLCFCVCFFLFALLTSSVVKHDL